MNRRTLAVMLVLLLLVGGVMMNRSHPKRSTVTVLPPTAGEPISPPPSFVPPVPVAPIVPPSPAPVVIAPSAPTPPPEIAQSPPRDRRFWGNRGYVIKDTLSTYLTPSKLEELKREYLSAPAGS